MRRPKNDPRIREIQVMPVRIGEQLEFTGWLAPVGWPGQLPGCLAGPSSTVTFAIPRNSNEQNYMPSVDKVTGALFRQNVVLVAWNVKNAAEISIWDENFTLISHIWTNNFILPTYDSWRKY